MSVQLGKIFTIGQVKSRVFFSISKSYDCIEDNNLLCIAKQCQLLNLL